MSKPKLRDNNLVIAGGLAVLAALLTMVYVARSGGGSGTASASPGPRATVFLATRDIPTGTAAANLFTRGYVTAKEVPLAAVAPGAITTRAQLRGLVAVQPVYAGEQLVDRRFGESGVTGVLSQLTGTDRVIKISGDAQQLLTGVVKPGDHVDVDVSMHPPKGDPFGKVALHDLLVVDVAASAPAASAVGGSASGWVTLQATDREARKLFFIVKNGDWSLVLRPFVRPKDHPPTNITVPGVQTGQD